MDGKLCKLKSEKVFKVNLRVKRKESVLRRKKSGEKKGSYDKEESIWYLMW